MQIQPDRMIHLGYAKYWRSDRIAGLLPIEEDRGPGRRTQVFVSGRSEPVIASRTEESILEDMVRERAEASDLREILTELNAALQQLSPVLKRMLRNEEGFDVRAWIRRLSALEESPPARDDGQEELFPS